jgi:hypothetical protein
MEEMFRLCADTGQAVALVSVQPFVEEYLCVTGDYMQRCTELVGYVGR